MNNNGKIYALIVTSFFAAAGLAWTLVEYHSGQPHADAVHVRELERVIDRLDLMDSKLDKLLHERVK